MWNVFVEIFLLLIADLEDWLIYIVENYVPHTSLIEEAQTSIKQINYLEHK